jgi:hypothetical protein
MRRSRVLLLVLGVFMILLTQAVRAPRDRGSDPAGAALFASRSAASELHITWPPGETRTPDPFPGDRSDRYVPPYRRGLSVGLEVLVDGRPLPTVRYRGRTYLPVPRRGVEYDLRVWNHGGRRIDAILSVDGLSVIKGRPASVNGAGYLVDPHSAIVIRGWRKNLQTVAAFRFEERQRSYASRRGYPENIGVIGLFAVEERTVYPRPFPEPLERRAEARKSAAVVGGTGTGYGRDIDAPARYVPFVRSNNTRMIVFYYDTVAALRQAGVPVDNRSPMDDTDFAPPPPP